MTGSVDHVLELGLGLTKTTTHNHLKKQPPANYFEPSLTLSLSGETSSPLNAPPYYGFNSSSTAEEAAPNYSSQASPRYCNSASVASSLSHNVVVKRERETTAAPTVSDEVEAEKTLSRGGSDGEEDEGNTRKKLRLTKEQSVLLEESFKQHSTLNPKQKQALANQLNLRPRQVEVWFQNRRARTKLKQTEVDCELLKKCCETLTDENRRLQKELQELKSLKLTNPFYMQLPAATLTMCPSCERIGSGVGNTAGHHGVGGGIGAAGNPNITFAAKSHHHHHHQLYNSYTNPSAAC